MDHNTIDCFANLLAHDDVPVEYDILDAEGLFQFAKDRCLLAQLHSFAQIHLEATDSSLRDYYQWKNLQSGLKEAEKKFPTEFESLSADFVKYLVLFGERYVLLESLGEGISADGVTAKASSLPCTSVSTEWFSRPLDPDAQEQPLRLVGQVTKDGFQDFLFCESVQDFSYDDPDPSWLSESGKRWMQYMRVKRRKVVSGVHIVRVSADRKHAAYLIDVNTCVNDSPIDKRDSIRRLLVSGEVWSQSFQAGLKRVFFFPAIAGLFQDRGNGRVVGAKFLTDTGSRFIHTSESSGACLREEQILQHQRVDFTRIHVLFPAIRGLPFVKLDGTSSILEKPDASLEYFQSRFGVGSIDERVLHMREVLKYANS